MKIKIRYNNEFQTLEVDRNEMWVSLALGNSDEPSVKEMEKNIQDKFNEMFNRPEYNNWHRHNRHNVGNAVPKRPDGKKGCIQISDEETEISATNTIDLFPDNTDAECREMQDDYEAICGLLRKHLKPEQAELLIQVHINKEPKQVYATELGITPSAISHRLKTAEKNLKKYFQHPQVFTFHVAIK